ncbi:MAG: YtxH domain-containing protein [Pedobacter sp.]|uniref:YtxH domain-containing protein n=1 Tax=Pedobacter sp. TaxID=1411316 RepID=UPI00356702B5
MNYRKQFNKIMSGRNDNSVMVGFALIGGIAIGAALSVLFAPKKGTELREGITQGGRRLCGTVMELAEELKSKFSNEKSPLHQSSADEDNINDENTPAKKPKSDIGEFIQQAHQNANESQS